MDMKFMVREMSHRDIESLYKFMVHPDIAYLTDNPPTSYEDFESKYRLYTEGQALDLKIFVIVLDGIVIGKMELGYDMDNKTGVFEIVIGNKQFWGTGIAKKAMDVLFAYGFNNLGLNKLSCEVYAFNTRSIHFMKKIGMHLDGILRQDRMVHHQYVDVYLFSKLKREFEGGVSDD
jgi:RimJ/RimL family protein N-acetyltransferase